VTTLRSGKLKGKPSAHLLRPFLFVVCLLIAPRLRAQTIPCLVGHGPGTNSWFRDDGTPLGLSLQIAAAAHHNQPADADKLYQASLAQAEALPDTDTCKAAAFFFAGQFYHQTGDGSKALALQERAVTLDEIALPPDHPRLVLEVRELADYYASAHKLPEAERCYQRALSIMENAQGLTNLERMFTYMNAASFDEEQKKYAPAETLYRQALSAAANLQPSLQEWSLRVRAQLALVLREEGKPEEAHALLDEPTAPIPAPPVGEGPAAGPDLSAPLSEMVRAKQYASEGNQQQAEALYVTAVSMLEKVNHPWAEGNLLGALVALGDLYRREQRYSDSETSLLRAFALWERIAGAPRSKLAASPLALGTLEALYTNQDRLPEIEPFYQRTIQVQERMLGTDDLAISITLVGLADIYRREDKYDAALPLFQRALAIQEAEWGPDDPKIAGVLDPYAMALEKANRPDEAAELRTRAERLRKH
jgi:tetratricopeptide (TPR) repeat protein